jgi:hypothetical protein
MMRYEAPTAALFAEPDDHVLRSRPDASFVRIVESITHATYRSEAQAYYAALFKHNKRRPEPGRRGRPPSKEAAAERVAEAWIGTRGSGPVLFEIEALTPADQEEPEADELQRGVGGRPPTDFVFLLRAFMGVATMGLPPEPAMVHTILTSNPAFARLCGFGYALAEKGRVVTDSVPSLRKLEEFDQVMAEAGIWGAISTRTVRENLESGRVELEEDLVADTTHYRACSGFSVAQVAVAPAEAAAQEAAPPPETAAAQEAVAPPETAAAQESTAAGKAEPAGRRAPRKKVRRAVPRVAKRCGCAEKEHCTHNYVPTDEGAGVVTKGAGSKKHYWAHKAAIIAFGRTQIPIDAVAVSYAGTNDGLTLVPHLARVNRLYPIVIEYAKRVLADGAYQTAANLAGVAALGLKLLAPINQRGTKPKPAEDLPGIKHFTPSGVPVCEASKELAFVGRRLDAHQLLWGAPREESGEIACRACPLRETCCPEAKNGRTLTTNAADFPQIDWDLPQHSKTFKRNYSLRTAVERVINILKLDLNNDRLTKRDNVNFQARLDKTLLAIHLLIASGY